MKLHISYCHLKGVIAAAIIVCFFAPPAYCATRLETLQPKTEQPYIINVNGEKQTLYRQSHALIVTMSDYTSSKGVWKNIPKTEEEGDQLSSILQNNGFTVRRGHDLSSKLLNEELFNFFNVEAKKKDGRVIFFYSGHGHRVKEFNTTFLIPIDGTDPESESFYLTAYSINLFKLSATEMSARQALFIFDNCYAGVVLKSLPPTPSSIPLESSARYKAIRSLANLKVRHFISAGGEDQQLPSPSIFMKGLIQGLQGAASTRADGYITGKELALFVESYVRNLGVGNNIQTPASALINEVMGDMVFQYDPEPAAQPSNLSPERSTESPRQVSEKKIPAEGINSVRFTKPTVAPEIEEGQKQIRRDEYALCKNSRDSLPKYICDERKKEFEYE
ncbi:hypothetical protein D9M68_285820 [compost metagenome]